MRQLVLVTPTVCSNRTPKRNKQTYRSSITRKRSMTKRPTGSSKHCHMMPTYHMLNRSEQVIIFRRRTGQNRKLLICKVQGWNFSLYVCPSESNFGTFSKSSETKIYSFNLGSIKIKRALLIQDM